MLTLKQLDALRWIAMLGSFERAAKQLHTTQSAISKRIQELEAVLGVELFDRSQRGARLTLKGEAVLTIGENMLSLRDKLVTEASGGTGVIQHLKFGVTELTALTWLASFVSEIRQSYPGIVLEPEVEQSLDLISGLESGVLDFIVVPDAFRRPRLQAVSLAAVENVWMSSPRLMPSRHIISIEQLTDFPVLVQGGRSGSGLVYERWLQENNVEFKQYIRSNSLVALVGLTISAVGVSYLPKDCFRKLVELEELRIIQTDPALPPVTYVIIFRDGADNDMIERISHLARGTCDFTVPIRWS